MRPNSSPWVTFQAPGKFVQMSLLFQEPSWWEVKLLAETLLGKCGFQVMSFGFIFSFSSAGRRRGLVLAVFPSPTSHVALLTCEIHPCIPQGCGGHGEPPLAPPLAPSLLPLCILGLRAFCSLFFSTSSGKRSHQKHGFFFFLFFFSTLLTSGTTARSCIMQGSAGSCSARRAPRPQEGTLGHFHEQPEISFQPGESHRAQGSASTTESTDGPSDSGNPTLSSLLSLHTATRLSRVLIWFFSVINLQINGSKAPRASPAPVGQAGPLLVATESPHGCSCAPGTSTATCSAETGDNWHKKFQDELHRDFLAVAV